MNKKNHFIDKISNEETAALPAIEFKGEIRIVDQERDIAEACRTLMQQPVIGFDTETRPSFRPGVTFRVSLLQLSTPRQCFLFRLNKIPFSKPILQLLEAKNVLKIGADVAGDLRSLRQIRHFHDGGFVDLQAIAADWGIEEKSLRKLSAIILGQRVSKAQRLSNWEATTFTDKQKVYAATDAWVCTVIYDRLLHTEKIKPTVRAASTAKADATSTVTAKPPKSKRRRKPRTATTAPASTQPAADTAVKSNKRDTPARPKKATTTTVPHQSATNAAVNSNKKGSNSRSKKATTPTPTTVPQSVGQSSTRKTAPRQPTPAATKSAGRPNSKKGGASKSATDSKSNNKGSNTTIKGNALSKGVAASKGNISPKGSTVSKGKIAASKGNPDSKSKSQHKKANLVNSVRPVKMTITAKNNPARNPKSAPKISKS